jgi:hypothetical protein
VLWEAEEFSNEEIGIVATTEYFVKANVDRRRPTEWTT